MKQLCIYPKEVATITGKSQTTAQTLVRTIKDALEKEKHQVLTIREFCDYMGIPFEDVFNMINNIKTQEDRQASLLSSNDFRQESA
ncbi:hypothetical protein [Winogradskyella sediminis]|uniref:Uncharacterized protein n=1 Tax=Winogradskyella sediminis TaxID=1382466 RepID=A0A1H1VHA0_9FLAO|nr:hypothetical protein [Winogradskyella sediminis]REG87718.1 hypothetical protein C8N41_102563 [Winogradskyella sediminis]SDS83950.1 hypothetical protein SAMN04489797_2551 [Winogradskyella sediminis]